jgi:GTP cyclohydrolase I
MLERKTMNVEKMEQGMRLFLEGMEVEDTDGQHLKDTPKRIVKAWAESFLNGYAQDPKQVLGTIFQDPCSEMIVVKDIPFASMCAHHFLPFIGKAKIGYIPNGKIVGLSKLARVLECFSQRLQIQERLTQQVAEAINVALGAYGVGVILTATHQCMTLRGIKKPGSETITSSMLGVFRSDEKARHEFLSL